MSGSVGGRKRSGRMSGWVGECSTWDVAATTDPNIPRCYSNQHSWVNSVVLYISALLWIAWLLVQLVQHGLPCRCTTGHVGRPWPSTNGWRRR